MPPTTEMPQQPFETANRNANIPTNAITIPLWPSAAAPHRVSDFTLQRDSPSSAEFKARCGLGVSGGGGGSTLHGGMGMSLTAQAAMDVLGGGRVERVKVDYRGGVPLPGLVHGRVNVVEKEGQKTAESNIVDLGTGKPLVQCVASFAALSSGPAVVRPRRSELPSKLKELMAKYPTVNHAYNESPHVVSNMTAPSSSYRFEHPTGIAFIWKTIYGPGQLERSYEVMTPEFGEVWYELVNKDGCLSGKDGALHPGVLFGITEYVSTRLSFARLINSSRPCSQFLDVFVYTERGRGGFGNGISDHGIHTRRRNVYLRLAPNIA